MTGMVSVKIPCSWGHTSLIDKSHHLRKAAGGQHGKETGDQHREETKGQHRKETRGPTEGDKSLAGGAKEVVCFVGRQDGFPVRDTIHEGRRRIRVGFLLYSGLLLLFNAFSN